MSRRTRDTVPILEIEPPRLLLRDEQTPTIAIGYSTTNLEVLQAGFMQARVLCWDVIV